MQQISEISTHPASKTTYKGDINYDKGIFRDLTKSKEHTDKGNIARKNNRQLVRVRKNTTKQKTKQSL